MELVRKVYPLSRLPLQGPNDYYKDEGALILLPPLDFMNWVAWTDERGADNLILAKIRHVETGLQTIAVVGSAELEDDVFGEIYMTRYLMHLLGMDDKSANLVRISPCTENIPRGLSMKVSHDCELAVELGLNVFERLQETIMDWPLIQKGGEVKLVFPDAGDLVVVVTVTELEPAEIVRLGGELNLEIDGPAVEEHVWGLKEPEAEPVPVPVPAPEPLELPPEERRRKVRESWLNRFTSAS